MSDPEKMEENFLRRWSQRKRMADTAPGGESEPPPSGNAETASPADAGGRRTPDLPTFDPATLPPIDSITAATDIRAFLAPGVPEELARAALRRAWVTDPAIRDFVGLAENQWDFTKPDSVPGFGSLELTPQLRHILARLVGEPTEEPPAHGGRDKPMADESAKLPARDAAPAVAVVDAAPPSAELPLVRQSNDQDAAVHTERGEADITQDITQERPHHRHGGALPR